MKSFGKQELILFPYSRPTPLGICRITTLPGMILNQSPPDDAKPRQLNVDPSGNQFVDNAMLQWLVPDRRRLAGWSIQALTEDRSCRSNCLWAKEKPQAARQESHSSHRLHGLIGQAINQYGWNALLIDSTGEVLWTSVKGLNWIVFSTDPARRKRWRRMVDRWWRSVQDRKPAPAEPIGCIWGRKHLWLTQWSASQPESLLVAMLRPSQLRGLMHHRWLELLAGANSGINRNGCPSA